MRKLLFFCVVLPLACSGQTPQFSFTSPTGASYTVTVTQESSSGLGFAGHWLYEPSVILPSSLTSDEYVLLFNTNTTANTLAWPTTEAIYMQTSSDGLTWGTPTAILSNSAVSNICDMIDAKTIYDISASLWRVFVQGTEYSGGTCSTDNQLFEATGSSLSSLSWYGSGGTATSISGDLGSPGLGEPFQWFNTANYDGPSSTPLLYIYNDWNYSPAPSDMFAYLTANAEAPYSYWYYTTVAYGASGESGPGAIYLDVLLGGSQEGSTYGPPGFTMGSSCASSGQYGDGVGFYPTPVPNNTSTTYPESLPGQFIAGEYDNTAGNLIQYPRFARNPYGFLDPTGSTTTTTGTTWTTLTTWTTFLYYSASLESGGSYCPSGAYPTFQSTFRNNGSSGNPSSTFGVSQVTITESISGTI
jgi:hypothetical protein